MPNTKKNKGIAFEWIKRSMKEGKKLVTDVEMSSTWQKAKEQAVDKLLSNQYGKKVNFRDPHGSFIASLERPNDVNTIIDEINIENGVVYISIKTQN